MKDARQLVLERHKQMGMGLAGSCEAIARWLFREHDIVTSDSWVASVIREDRERNVPWEIERDWDYLGDD